MPAKAPAPRKPQPSFSHKPGAHFDIVELGAGRANLATNRTRLRNGKKVVLVDVAYSRRKNRLADPKFREMAEDFRKRALALHERGITIVPGESTRFLHRMVDKNWKTKSIFIEMPHPNMFANPLPLRDKYDPFVHFFKMVCDVAPKVLLPNGKIYLTTERPEFVSVIEEIARERGLSFRKKPSLTTEQAKWRTETSQEMSRRGKTIFQVEITLPLKKVFPTKGERRGWKGNQRISTQRE